MDPSGIPDIVPALLQVRSERTPTAAAYFARSKGGLWQSKTWREVWREVSCLSASLQNRGLSAGDRLGILLPTCYEWEVAQQASLVAGAVVVGIDPRSSRDATIWLLEHADVNWLVTNDVGLKTIPDYVLDVMHSVIVVNKTQPVGASNRVAWSDLVDGTPVAGDGIAQLGQRCAKDIATILYTSGTTGQPKGIAITHRQIMVACRAISMALPELTERDSTVCWLPMSALFQRVVNLTAIAAGMGTHFVEDPRQILKRLPEISPTFFIGVPRFYEKLQELLHQTPPETTAGWRRRIRCMISGSAALRRPILEDLFERGLLVLEAYGLSENTVPMATNRMGDYRFGSVGKPLPQNELRFAEDGEILVKSPGLFQGYYNEGRCSERFTEDGYYRTGDCGYLDDEGFLYLTGRKSEIIKTSTGRRISPVGIEAVYAQSPYLGQVVVCGERRKHLVALVSLNMPQMQSHFQERESPSNQMDEISMRFIEERLIGEIKRLETALSPHQRVRAIGVLATPLTLERGEITVAAKLRRSTIKKNHQALIERLYGTESQELRVVWESSTGSGHG